MPVWFEYRDESNCYVPYDVVEQAKNQDAYTLVECYAKEYPEHSAFSYHGHIRGDRRVNGAPERFFVEKHAQGLVSSAPVKDISAARTWVKGADAYRIKKPDGSILEEHNSELLDGVGNSFTAEQLVERSDFMIPGKRMFYD